MRACCFLFIVLTVRAQDAAKGVNFYSLAKEQALGEQLATEVRRDSTAFDSPSTLAFVKELGDRLAGPQNQFRYTFALITDPDTLLHEPTALPGGFVFVPASL